MIRLRAVPKRNELMKGRTVDNSERNEIRVAHIKRNVHPSKSMCLFEKSCTEYKQSPKERDLYYYVSDLIGGHIDFGPIGILRCVGKAYFISSCVVCSMCLYEIHSRVTCFQQLC